MLHLSEQLSTEDVHRIAYLFYMAFFFFSFFSIQYFSIVTNRALSNLCISYLYDLVVSVIEFVYIFMDCAEKMKIIQLGKMSKYNCA
jgi:hypothetical protein